MRIGAHVRRGGSGGVSSTVSSCRERGADAAQIFVSNPRGWAPPRVSPEDAAAFRAEWAESGLWPLVAHAPYLVNIASPNPEFLQNSRTLTRATVHACDELGVEVLVLHAGAGGSSDRAAALTRAAETLREASSESEHVRVAVELMAGTSGAVASTLKEASVLLQAAGSDSLALCLDTCHLLAAGYGLDEPEGVAGFFDELVTEGLAARVALVHANDSMYERGAKRDRHANIGEGYIGLEGWRAILARPEMAGMALIVETPGEAAGQAKDIEHLRELAPSGPG